jgi:hypothetical protein
MLKLHSRTIAWLDVLSSFLLMAPMFTQQADPLPSWNDGPAKKAILDFVRLTTDKASPKFVPPEQRVVAFDQDGTLWVEHPMYTQMIYCWSASRRWSRRSRN